MKTHVENIASRLREQFPTDGNGRAAAEAIFIALNQPGSLVRVTIDKTEHMDAVDRIVTALDDLSALDWKKYRKQYEKEKDDDTKNLTLELRNGSGIEIRVANNLQVSKTPV